MKTLREIMQRKAEIRELLKAPDANLEELAAELDDLEVQERSIRQAAETRAALEARVANTDAGEVVSITGRMMGAGASDAGGEERTFDASSPEYRSAFFKTLAQKTTGEFRLGELTDVEQRAFTHLTSNTSEVVLPAGTQARIWDLITERFSLLGDISWSNFAGVYPFLQATSLEAGDPVVTAENVADGDMETGWNKVELTGKEVKPIVKLSQKMQIQSVDGFEDYLVRKLAERAAVRLNKIVVAAIAAGTLAGNKQDIDALTEPALRGALAKLKGASRVIVYASYATIWNDIAGLKDGNERSYFIASEQTDDPTLQGRIFGKAVKVDDTLGDGVIRIGDPDTIEANMFQDFKLATAQDVLGGTFEIVHAGYALFDCALGDTRAWAEILITPGA